MQRFFGFTKPSTIATKRSNKNSITFFLTLRNETIEFIKESQSSQSRGFEIFQTNRQLLEEVKDDVIQTRLKLINGKLTNKNETKVILQDLGKKIRESLLANEWKAPDKKWNDIEKYEEEKKRTRLIAYTVNK